MTMPAGTYFIGDLCYVLNGPGEWDSVCALTINGPTLLSGEFTLPDGRRFAMYNTQYGDGLYIGSVGRYPVDSGTIGCIKLSDIAEFDTANENDVQSFGAIVDFESDFETF